MLQFLVDAIGDQTQRFVGRVIQLHPMVADVIDETTLILVQLDLQRDQH